MCSYKNPLMIKVLAAVALIFALPAFAGTKDGGGGGAYVCRNADGSVKHSLMADLWESEHTPFKWAHKTGKLHMSYSNEESAEAQFTKAMNKLAALDPGFAADIRRVRDELFQNKNSLEEGVAIALPDDLKLGYYPVGCAPEGVMYYNGESEQLDVREELFATLRTQTDIAAAWAHEAVYKIFRGPRQNLPWAYTSKFARHFVGCLFSDEQGCFQEKAPDVQMSKVGFICESPSYSVSFYFPDGVTDPSKLKDGFKILSVWNRVGNMGLVYKPKGVHWVSRSQDSWRGSFEGAYTFQPYSPFATFEITSMVHLFNDSGKEIRLSVRDGKLDLTVSVQGYSRYADDGHSFVRKEESLNCQRQP